MPHDLDERFQQGIKDVIRAHGQRPEEVLSVRINYRLTKNGMQVLVQQMETRDGSVVANGVFAL